MESPHDVSESAAAQDVFRRANAAFVAGLAHIVNVSTLSEGDGEYNYYVHIPSRELHIASQRIAELEFDIEERFGVKVNVLTIPT